MTQLFEKRSISQIRGANRIGLLHRRILGRAVRAPGANRELGKQDSQVERLAAIGRNLTALVHESRNALQRGQSNLDMLSLELEGQPELLKLTTRAQRALDEIRHLFSEVRSYAAPLHLEHTRIDLVALWSEVWAELAGVHGDKTIRFIENVRCADTWCDIDVYGMRQVFRNIFENAIDVCPASGCIVVECTDSELDSEPALHVAIRDNGSGIHCASAEEIFKPFYTTKRCGTGLGMAIAKQIVVAHGGQITAHSAIESGAEVEIRLPRTH